MSLHLILMRHAKSDWDDPALTDKQRPLNARGRRDATALGAWLQAQGLRPDLALVSDAERTAETWLRLSAEWPAGATMRPQPAFYNAGPERLLAGIRQARADRLLVLAHNPGIGMLAETLCATAPGHPRFADYPTGATCVLEFAADNWADIGRGSLVHFITPADLPT